MVKFAVVYLFTRSQIDLKGEITMRYIFIDTNIYMQKQFDFNNAIFISLIDMVENNQIRVLTTSVSNSEVKKKIKDKLKGEIKDFKPKLIKTEKNL